jgi:integrase
LRCGEIMALEWADVDLHKRQLCVARSDWKGHVTVPKGGRQRYVPLTKRLSGALRATRHLRGRRVLCDAEGQPLTQKMVQITMRRVARRANVRPGVHIHPAAHLLFTLGNAGGTGTGDPGVGRPRGSRDDSAIHAPESSGHRRCNPIAGVSGSGV